MSLSLKRKPKYIRLKWDGWYFIADIISNDKELALWLKDGSLLEGDILYEVSSAHKIVKKNGKLILEVEEEKVRFS